MSKTQSEILGLTLTKVTGLRTSSWSRWSWWRSWQTPFVAMRKCWKAWGLGRRKELGKFSLSLGVSIFWGVSMNLPRFYVYIFVLGWLSICLDVVSFPKVDLGNLDLDLIWPRLSWPPSLVLMNSQTCEKRLTTLETLKFRAVVDTWSLFTSSLYYTNCNWVFKMVAFVGRWLLFGGGC